MRLTADNIERISLGMSVSGYEDTHILLRALAEDWKEWARLAADANRAIWHAAEELGSLNHRLTEQGDVLKNLP